MIPKGWRKIFHLYWKSHLYNLQRIIIGEQINLFIYERKIVPALYLIKTHTKKAYKYFSLILFPNHPYFPFSRKGKKKRKGPRGEGGFAFVSSRILIQKKE